MKEVRFSTVSFSTTKLAVMVALVTAVAVQGWQAKAQIYDTNNVAVQTFAGSGFSGYVDGVGQQTMFNSPAAIVADTSGNLFVYDYYNTRIRKITPDGTVSTFAGGGGSMPGQGTNANLPFAETLAIDHSNTLYFVAYPSGTSLIRIGSDGYVSSIPLNGLAGGQVRDGLCVDSSNNVYIADSNGNKIYRYRTNGVLEVFAGSGNYGSVDGNGIFTSFGGPAALAADAADNVYVWDSGNHLIRRINQNRDVVTITGPHSDSDGSGTNAGFSSVNGMCSNDSGDLILACGISVRRMTAATNVTTIAGSFTRGGYTNGAGNLALFNGADGVCISRGIIFVADSANNRIRSITFNPTSQPVLPANLQLSTYPGLQITGTVGRTYQIQTSPDMNQWSTVTTLLLTSSPYLWIDQNPTAGSKFYRAFLLP
jgi:sugar lactone lactonase YvrE